MCWRCCIRFSSKKGRCSAASFFRRVEKTFSTRRQTVKKFGRQATRTRRRTEVRERLRAPPAADTVSKKEWQRSKFCERMRAENFGHRNREGASCAVSQNPCKARDFLLKKLENSKLCKIPKTTKISKNVSRILTVTDFFDSLWGFRSGIPDKPCCLRKIRLRVPFLLS